MEAKQLRAQYDSFWSKVKHSPMPPRRYPVWPDPTLAKMFAVVKGLGLTVRAELRETGDPDKPAVVILTVDNGKKVIEGGVGITHVPFGRQAEWILRGVGK